MPRHINCNSCGSPVYPGNYCCGNSFRAIQTILMQDQGSFGGGVFGGFGGGGLGIDVSDGDLVENLGDGIGIDLETGEVELEIAPGIDVPLEDW